MTSSIVPDYEDLSSARLDEETVLSAVYGDDFTSSPGVWNCPCWAVNVRPDILDSEKVGSRLTLCLQLNKKYPYVVPKIDTKNIEGLSPEEVKELHRQLQKRATELAQSGSVMMVELVQVAEDFLLEHNRDPTMSAWEQMQEREKNQRIKDNEASEALDKLMDEKEKPSASFHYEETSSGRRPLHVVGSNDYSDVEREILRQQAAMESARKLRASSFGEGPTPPQNSGVAGVDGEDDENDFDIDLDYSPAASGTSRYETDFIEMGVLGRGGGGEVVKARNRLDGRIYAIKKILLEREDGAMAKIGALQNQKLRREVTTISRMTHPNIVRYYQAWVEGDGTEEEDPSGTSDVGEPSTSAVGAIPEEEPDDDDEEESESSRGFWASSSGPSDDDQNQSDKNDQPNLESDSVDAIFNEDFGLQSPLMNGIGFQNQLYHNLLERNDSPSNSDESIEDGSSEWSEESSVKVGSGIKGRKILYIQMEYCSTTLRKLIDDRKVENMEEKDVWKLIRQIIEALAYIHSRCVKINLFCRRQIITDLIVVKIPTTTVTKKADS
jgi:eukaryotic translation initiation factor 2-alpha kinase 4